MAFLRRDNLNSTLLFSIHPSSAACPGVGSRGQQPKQGGPDFPLPGHFHQFFLGDPEEFPGPFVLDLQVVHGKDR